MAYRLIVPVLAALIWAAVPALAAPPVGFPGREGLDASE